MTEHMLDEENFEVDLNALLEAEADAVPLSAAPTVKTLTLEPLFRTLFLGSVDKNDGVLRDFGTHVVGPLSGYFALKAAKGGTFFEEKQAAGAPNADRYSRDQTLRAHLINGMLPALRVARLLSTWGAKPLRDWDEQSERLFIAGYMLHDFLKIPAAQETLKDAGFPTYKEMSSPSIGQIPTLERIFTEWGGNLGLDEFLKPIGGVAIWAQDLIYIACNTQVLSGTLHNTAMLPNLRLDYPLLKAVTLTSCLADLMAYVAPTPREMVAQETIKKLIGFELGDGRDGLPVARLTYHHVAENRGLLLNLIHNAALNALKIEDVRVPLLYAPSGVVYLERHDAPAMPSPTDLAAAIVAGIRQTAGDQVAKSGKGYEVSKDGYRVNETYRDLFDLREFILMTPRLVTKVKGNAPQYIEFLRTSGWPHIENMPPVSTDKQDSRLRQMAEWASVIDIQIEKQFPAFTEVFIAEVLEAWNTTDLASEFQTLRQYNQRGTGVRHRWYWLAAHALSRASGILPEKVLEWLEISSKRVVNLMPESLPETSQVNPQLWNDLTHYVESVLSINHVRSANGKLNNEITQYTQAKVKRSNAVCALCGSNYPTREQVESAVPFQPGVYTARLEFGIREPKRSICSICTIEQLLRQLFMTNISTGKSAESFRPRYLSFYPSYFFTPETLSLVRKAYHRFKNLQFDEAFISQLRDVKNLSDITRWQQLGEFMLGEANPNTKNRYQVYDESIEATVFTIGMYKSDNKVTDTESWILPTLLAMVFAINLDVKVIVSETSIPLITEASEFKETIWLDGAHASIRELLQQTKQSRVADQIHTTPAYLLNIDQIAPSLTRLITAYIIHLDAERRGWDENWGRFGSIARDLVESPLYVFHYLSKQKTSKHPIADEKRRRYIAYAEEIFSHKGDRFMNTERNYPKELVNHYSNFYRVARYYGASSYLLLRPLDIIADAIMEADPLLFNSEEALIGMARGTLDKRLAGGQGSAFVFMNASADKAKTEFCRMFVHDIFIGIFNQDVGALRGKQMNLLRNACEFYFTEAMHQVKEERDKAKAEATSQLSTDPQ